MTDISGMLVWVTWMARWGEASPEHGYAAGVYTDPMHARKRGEDEAAWRGNKYEMQHAPARIDFEHNTGSAQSFTPLAPAGVTVFVASVVRERQGVLRQHFLGVFSHQQRAVDVASGMYPGWSVKIDERTVESLFCKP